MGGGWPSKILHFNEDIIIWTLWTIWTDLYRVSLLATVIFVAVEHCRSDALANLPELREEENAENCQRPASFARAIIVTILWTKVPVWYIWTRQLAHNAEVRHFVHELVGWVIAVIKL